jgi:multidrug efflux pump subunit AcrB
MICPSKVESVATAQGPRQTAVRKGFGDDLTVLKNEADQIAAVVSKVRGAGDVRAERVAGLPYLRIKLRREELARHGLDASDVLDTIQAIGGKPAGEVLEGNSRFAIQVRFRRHKEAAMKRSPVFVSAIRTDTLFHSVNWRILRMRKALHKSAWRVVSAASVWKSMSAVETPQVS